MCSTFRYFNRERLRTIAEFIGGLFAFILFGHIWDNFWIGIHKAYLWYGFIGAIAWFIPLILTGLIFFSILHRMAKISNMENGIFCILFVLLMYWIFPKVYNNEMVNDMCIILIVLIIVYVCSLVVYHLMRNILSKGYKRKQWLINAIFILSIAITVFIFKITNLFYFYDTVYNIIRFW